MHIEKTSLDGFYIITSKLHSDSRGNFLKNYHSTSFNNLNLDNNFMESYFSVSKKNVFRGLHFQTPPYDHAKLVSLVAGEALDVVVDLRKSSKSYGHYEKVKLTTSDTQILYLSSGLAHGFLSLVLPIPPYLAGINSHFLPGGSGSSGFGGVSSVSFFSTDGEDLRLATPGLSISFNHPGNVD